MWIRRTIVFAGALVLYLICLDRGASLWDCPEYILTAWRLEIGHPPGNPTWQLIANVISHLGGSGAHAAVIINALSAVAMALAAMFLSSVSYLLLRASLFKSPSRASFIWANICAGCGAMCYAWCDSAIFSAVEAEVYALSAMFTILMLLLALKWACKRAEGNVVASRRLLILTAYLAGLGVGVHELNFLILPAMALVYWYGARKYPIESADNLKRRFRTDWMPTALWSMALFCIGTLTYLILPIRASANPPLNTGNPSDWQRLVSYYNRDQYAGTPLLYGRTPYSRPLLNEDYDPESGEYSYTTYFLQPNKKGKNDYVYPDELNMWFPRMTGTSADDIEFYEKWAGMTRDRMIPTRAATAIDSAGNQTGRMNPETGKREYSATYRPTYLQQAAYFFKYQVGFMYMRYLMWNFSGRQNNLTAQGGKLKGNFITGFGAIDDAMLGPQEQLSPDMRENNRGYNRYFMIPLIAGLIGVGALCIAGRDGRRVCSIVALFFFFTGLLIVVYLNQGPGEPRDRDYSFLGSYMAYAIWIACGMAAIVKLLLKMRFKNHTGSYIIKGVAALVCAVIPLQMLSQTYDDHYRPAITGAEEVIAKVLDGVEPNAIVAANGDNVIFPLWYAQEVLGIRRDITVVAIPYLPTDWYRESLRIPGEGAPGLKLGEKVPSGRGSISDRAIEEIIILNGADRPVYKADRIAPAVRIDTIENRIL